MPRTVEHIVATHQLARARVRSGQPAWSETIDLRATFHNSSLTFFERRDAIVAQLRRSRWYENADPLEFDGVRDIVDDHLAHAEAPDDWDSWWDELYDLADFDRVWIETR